MYKHAFNVSPDPQIISTISGQIISANRAACKLFGYSSQLLLTKNRTDILDINDKAFIKLLRKQNGEDPALKPVSIIKKSGSLLACEISSVVFSDEEGDKVISLIVNMGKKTSRQNEIDERNAKTVIQNIKDVKTRQKKIDLQNHKAVAYNIKLAKLKQADIDSKKEITVSKNIALAKAKQKIIDTKNNKTVSDNIKIVEKKQREIDTRKEKLVAKDILEALAKSDARIAENNEWVKYIAKTSYDVMWDWDILKGTIYVGDSIKEVFGYDVKNNIIEFSDFTSCLVEEEKQLLKRKLKKVLLSADKTWNDDFMFKRYDGSVAFVSSRACIVRDEKKKAIRFIGAIKDVSRLHELEKNIDSQVSLQRDSQDALLDAGKISFDGIWDWNLLTNEFFLSESFEELFGYPLSELNLNLAQNWGNFIHPDDRIRVESGLKRAIESSVLHWEDNYKFMRSNGSIASVFGRANIFRDADGKAYRMIGAIHDLSKQHELEERLEQEIQLKKQQLAEASADAKDTERADIGKELHDNVNQLLGASKLYLEMAKRGDDNSAMYLNRSSKYTHAAIEEIRKLTKGLTTDIIKNLGLAEAVENMSHDTMEFNPVRIYCNLKKFNELKVNDKFKLTIFRIIQEQVNNIIKHASASIVKIILIQNKKSVLLSVSDDGVGFNTKIKGNGIGISNIKSRAEFYHGSADIFSQKGKGCLLKVTIPLSTQLNV